MAGGLSAFEEIDCHGMTVQEALAAVERKVKNADRSVYVIRVIHGFHGGTRIKDAVWDEYSNGMNSRVKEVRGGFNEGITELVLKPL